MSMILPGRKLVGNEGFWDTRFYFPEANINFLMWHKFKKSFQPWYAEYFVSFYNNCSHFWSFILLFLTYTFPYSALWWNFDKAQRDHFVSWLPWALWQQPELCVEDHSTRGSWDSSKYTCNLLVIITSKAVFPDARLWKDRLFIHFSISLMILTVEFITHHFYSNSC